MWTTKHCRPLCKRPVRLKRIERLEWDMMRSPHHCSYLTRPDRGRDETKPVKDVKWLFKDQMQYRGGIIVSTSKPIPAKGSDENKDPQPPHRQAANYYRRIVGEKDGEFIVTMEHPRESAPRPLVIDVDRFKARVRAGTIHRCGGVTSVSAPRAG